MTFKFNRLQEREKKNNCRNSVGGKCVYSVQCTLYRIFKDAAHSWYYNNINRYSQLLKTKQLRYYSRTLRLIFFWFVLFPTYVLFKMWKWNKIIHKFHFDMKKRKRISRVRILLFLLLLGGKWMCLVCLFFFWIFCLF